MELDEITLEDYVEEKRSRGRGVSLKTQRRRATKFQKEHPRQIGEQPRECGVVKEHISKRRNA